MESIVYRGTTYHRKYPDILRPLNEAEMKDLRDSAKMFGIRQSVMFNDELCIVDGWHRLVTAKELDIECPMFCIGKIGAEAEYRLALDLNEARRHLHPDEMHLRRQDRVRRIAARRAAGESMRKIAANEGISPAQVRRDLDEIAPEEGAPTARDEFPDLSPPSDSTGTEIVTPALAGPLLCDRCRRIGGGGVVGCTRCEDLRREAGQPTRPPPVKNKSKGGSTNSVPAAPPRFDWHAFDLAYSTVARLPHDVARLHPSEETSTEFHGTVRLLKELTVLWQGWRKRLEKEKHTNG